MISLNNKKTSKLIAICFAINSIICPYSISFAQTPSDTETSSSTSTTDSTITRTVSQEEKDYEIIQTFDSMGLNDSKKLAEVKAKIEEAEKVEKAGGEKMGDVTKSMKYVITQYEDVTSRMNANNISVNDLPTTKSQIATIKTEYKKAVADATTRCQTSKGKDCDLSEAGKSYARILSYIDNQQNNVTSSTSTSTNATNTNNTSASTNTNSGTTQKTTTTSCPTSYTLDSSAGKCCPTAQPKYNSADGKCYAKLPTEASSSSNNDMISKGLTALGAYMMLKNDGQTSSKSKSNDSNGDIKNNNNKNIEDLKSGVELPYKLSENPISMNGKDVSLTINPNVKKTSKNIKIKVRIPMYLSKQGQTIFKFVDFNIKEGVPTIIFPDTENSKIVLKETAGLPIIRVAGKYKMKLQYYKIDEKTQEESIIGVYTIPFEIVDPTTVITSDNDESNKTKITVSESIEAINSIILESTGNIQSAKWDSDRNACILNINGSIKDSDSNASAGDNNNYEVSSTKFTSSTCTNENLLNKNVSFDKLKITQDNNGASYLKDVGLINTSDNVNYYSNDDLSKIVGEYKFPTNVSKNGSIYTILTDAKGNFYSDNGNQLSKNDIEYIKKNSGIDLSTATVNMKDGIAIVNDSDGNEITAKDFDSTTAIVKSANKKNHDNDFNVIDSFKNGFNKATTTLQDFFNINILNDSNTNSSNNNNNKSKITDLQNGKDSSWNTNYGVDSVFSNDDILTKVNTLTDDTDDYRLYYNQKTSSVNSLMIKIGKSVSNISSVGKQ